MIVLIISYIVQYNMNKNLNIVLHRQRAQHNDELKLQLHKEKENLNDRQQK